MTSPGSNVALEPHVTIGRFEVIGPLGAGGMGVVFAAYDPKLDRNVAIKVLRPRRGTTSLAESRRIEAEAQAMARLAHPNVVTVFEIDRVGDRPFVAMELVEGATLRRWLDERPRPWPEILAMFVAAGQGLVAAHRERIVHRDFKPANVLIDRHGRPRVADFGLAAEITAAGSPDTPPSRAGTRKYMAPEQLRGEPCNEKADQFAFCVALWHAVHGSWPFQGDTPAELDAAIAAGRLVAPARRTPDWLRAALARGLAAAPDARWPSLEELLRVLGRDRSAKRRWSALGLTAVALVAITWFVVRAGEAVDPCAGADAARFAGIWDGPRKAAVQGAFHMTGLSYANDSWRRVEPVIDGYVAEWSRMATETCRATRIEARQSDALMDLRMRCLDERRSLLGALADLWIRNMNPGTLAQAIDAALKLPAVRECADSRALSERAPLPTDPARARMITAVRSKLAAVQALQLANRWPEAKQRAHDLRPEADATGWPQIRAEAALAEGRALVSLEQPAAEAPLLDTLRFAGEAHDDDLTARALINLVYVAGVNRNIDHALQLAEIADGAVSRAGNDGGRRGALAGYRALALTLGGQLTAAKTAYGDAVAVYTATFGAEARETMNAIADLSNVIVMLGDYPAAIKLMNDVLTRTIARFGTEHPRTANIWNNLGLAYEKAGDNDAAVANLRRALDIKRKVFGLENVLVAHTMENLGGVEIARGDLDEAQALLERSLAIEEHLLGREHGSLVNGALANLANLRRKQGRYAEAVELLNRALAIAVKTRGPTSDVVASLTEALAAVFAAHNELGSALERARQALDIRNKVLGTDHPDTFRAMAETAAVLARMHRCAEARPLVDTAIAGLERAQGTPQWGYQLALATCGECDLARGAAAEAIAPAERAVALARGAKEWPTGRGQYRWVLARALWTAGRHGDAIAAAQQAESELASDADGAINRAAVRAWLTAHAGPRAR